ncbi:hypothetical protein OAT67_01835 [Bacteriovoracaceae bacterium]|nr:hypothetical protein [Bacteriovoracaceae bacterium]
MIELIKESKPVIEILSALLAPFLAVWALYFTRRQHKLDSQKFKLDLYDRRFKVFEEIKKFLSGIIRDGKTDHKQLLNMLHQTNEAIFLFDDEISNYIKELYEKGLDFVLIDKKVNGEAPIPDYEDRNVLIEKSSEYLKFYGNQFDISRDKFLKYLKFEKL